jgi:hypothetical protein
MTRRALLAIGFLLVAIAAAQPADAARGPQPRKGFVEKSRAKAKNKLIRKFEAGRLRQLFDRKPTAPTQAARQSIQRIRRSIRAVGRHLTVDRARQLGFEVVGKDPRADEHQLMGVIIEETADRFVYMTATGKLQMKLKEVDTSSPRDGVRRLRGANVDTDALPGLLQKAAEATVNRNRTTAKPRLLFRPIGLLVE